MLDVYAVQIQSIFAHLADIDELNNPNPKGTLEFGIFGGRCAASSFRKVATFFSLLDFGEALSLFLLDLTPDS